MFFLFLPILLGAQNSDVREFHLDLLQQEEQKIKNRFLRAAGMSQTEWQYALRQASLDYDVIEADILKDLQDRPGLSEEIKNVVAQLLAEQELDPETVRLFGHAPGVGLTAYHSIIAISEQFLKNLNATKQETESLLMHEIMHILRQDEIERLCVRIIYKKVTSFRKLILAPIKRAWQFFREKRADILTGLTNKSRAQALATVYSKLLKSDLYYPYDSNHPPLRARIEYMQDLYEQLEQDKPKAYNVLEKSFFNLKHFVYRMADCYVPKIY